MWHHPLQPIQHQDTFFHLWAPWQKVPCPGRCQDSLLQPMLRSSHRSHQLSSIFTPLKGSLPGPQCLCQRTGKCPFTKVWKWQVLIWQTGFLNINKPKQFAVLFFLHFSLFHIYLAKIILFFILFCFICLFTRTVVGHTRLNYRTWGPNYKGQPFKQTKLNNMSSSWHAN